MTDNTKSTTGGMNTIVNTITMTVLVSSFIDVLKQIIPLYIRFENQSINYAIIGCIITLVNFIVGNFNMSYFFHYFDKHNNVIVNSYNEEYMLNKINKCNLQTICWDNDDKLWYKLKYFIVCNLHYKVKKFVIKINEKGNKVIHPNNTDMFSYTEFVELNKYFPLYMSGENIIGIGKNETSVYIIYNSHVFYNEFIEFIDKY